MVNDDLEQKLQHYSHRFQRFVIAGALNFRMLNGVQNLTCSCQGKANPAPIVACTLWAIDSMGVGTAVASQLVFVNEQNWNVSFNAPGDVPFQGTYLLVVDAFGTEGAAFSTGTA